MDAYGHVNNVVFLRYLEEARIDFLFRPDKDFQQGPSWHAMRSTTSSSWSTGTTPVNIELWVTQIRAASFTIAYEVKDPDQVYVRAPTVVVPYDLEAQRPRRLTAEEREFLAEYADDEDDPAGAVAA